MTRPRNQTTSAPRESARTTPMQRRSTRHQTTHAVPMLPKSPRKIKRQMIQNQNDEDT